MCDNILQYIAHTILLKCKNMFAMLILHALILHSGNNIEILPNPTRVEEFCSYTLTKMYVYAAYNTHTNKYLYPSKEPLHANTCFHASRLL